MILTSGLTGSSVLAGLIGRCGYWTGDSTVMKDYDTFENAELVAMNLTIMKTAGFPGTWAKEFSADSIEQIAALAVDTGPYRDFLAKCEAHRPWLWKDPRLWLTIRFWEKVLPLDDCRFIVLDRDPWLAWVAGNLRRHVRSFRSLNRYQNSITESALSFLKERRLSFMRMRYEDLIANPERVIGDLNKYLQTEITVDDLKAVYQGPLYKVPKSSIRHFVKAALIYLKNYNKRIDV